MDIKPSGINKDIVGKVVKCSGKLIHSVSTPRANLFWISDGLGKIKCMEFSSSAFNFKKGSMLNVVGLAQEENNEFILKVKGISECPKEELPDLEKAYETNISQSIRCLPEFLVESEALVRMQEEFVKAGEAIKRAVFEFRPIIIKHHADCDGYSGAIALERSIKKMVLDFHQDESSAWFYIKRSPMQTPFYDISDAIIDLGVILDEMDKYGRSLPLLVIVDNGSSKQDIDALKLFAANEVETIVIDHHIPAKSASGYTASSYSISHINPCTAGSDSNITAGMLSVELANIIGMEEKKSTIVLAALSGISDKSSGKEFEQYLKLAEESGFTRERLKGLAKVADFFSFNNRRFESRSLVEGLFGKGEYMQEHLIRILLPIVERKEKARLESLAHTCRIQQIGKDKGIVVASADIDKSTITGTFPLIGKSVGLLFDHLKEKYEKLLVAGIGKSMITVRMKGISKDINDFCGMLAKEMSYANIEGGGHPSAGSIKFIPSEKDKVFKRLLEWAEE
jgi:RecJ-like exonuclease